ncbi:cupredoxin family copper-binding protein [Streptomyces sp. NBC_01378]|uniref:Cupredoxin family copper-binding protein n=1 Tax=Streptomyces sp. NBC_00119 TaxID=2975659 RepID=A0AAU1UM29_9ACTN
MPRLNALRTVRILLAALLTTGTVTFLGTPTALAASHQVVMSGYAFGPRSVTITAGDTVTWVNKDQAPHDVKTTSGPESIHSPMLNKGGTWSHTFTTAGSYGYVCTVHPGMTAQLVVKPAAAPAPTSHPATHQHPSSAPAAAPERGRPIRSANAAAPPDDTDHSSKATPSTSDSPSPSTTPAAAAQQPPAVQGAASDTRPLDPLLLLAGVVAGVAVLCLLLVGSRSAAATSRNGGASQR